MSLGERFILTLATVTCASVVGADIVPCPVVGGTDAEYGWRGRARRAHFQRNVCVFPGG